MGFYYFLDGGSNLYTSSLIIPPVVSADQFQITSQIPLSAVGTSIVNSDGSLTQTFTTAQTMKGDGSNVTMHQQQVPSMIPVPSVTLRTLVLDLLGKFKFRTNNFL